MIDRLQFYNFIFHYINTSMQRSTSLNKISNNQSKMPKQKSQKTIQSYRLNFPIVGDTSLYSNYGRKHYDNHSDKMSKIILPFKYIDHIASQPYTYNSNTNNTPSYAIPHLIKQNQHSPPQPQRSQVRSPQTNIFSKDRQPKYGERIVTQPSKKKQNYFKIDEGGKKYDDELDKLEKFLDLKRNNPEATPRQKEKVVNIDKYVIEEQKISQKDNIQKEISSKISSLSIISSPQYSPISPNKYQMAHQTNDRSRYDVNMLMRSRNPTHLSSGLNIL